MSFNQKRETRLHQYVHWSGSVFVRMVDQPAEPEPLASPNVRKINFEENDEDELNSYKSSSQRVHLKVDSVLSDLGTDLDAEKFPTGFFWTPNFSLTKKWPSSYNGNLTSGFYFHVSYVVFLLRIYSNHATSHFCDVCYVK